MSRHVPLGSRARVLGLLLALSTLAQASRPGASPNAGAAVLPPAQGGYRLAAPLWVPQGTAASGRYAVSLVALPALAGDGCCCAYLPCVLQRP